ncbi:ribosome-associated translation inhibitor RaiA [Solwaraspora sp. WMMD406]|uniref:ribosome hibernation-promoting factor, HPF/YfiA family n=1 Tax=Solwaraspora sp. WMMD406 TaxID=3016095 RepID=UPI002417DADF|nr:ribosome-associated translation inhibitor RaiA [Solwaraspora sp. WMMD406]MDG4763940.1 ribosome-associated translation inhibitor RaiA [Solwaraspora sp. WMMD406]
MDIVVKGRNVEVPDHYREHVAEKLAKVERYDHKLMRVDVELFHERNPRQSDHCQRVELTCVSRGPVIRAEACAKDFYSALDAAISKLDTRLRRAADRRRVHRGRHAPLSVAEATAGLPTAGLDGFDPLPPARPADEGSASVAVLDRTEQDLAYDEPDDQPWHIVREKEHPGEPMTVDDALFQMELVGHDFYLFMDKESGRPSVVYRRKGYDYGILSLAEPTTSTTS